MRDGVNVRLASKNLSPGKYTALSSPLLALTKGPQPQETSTKQTTDKHGHNHGQRCITTMRGPAPRMTTHHQPRPRCITTIIADNIGQWQRRRTNTTRPQRMMMTRTTSTYRHDRPRQWWTTTMRRRPPQRTTTTKTMGTTTTNTTGTTTMNTTGTTTPTTRMYILRAIA